jgi:hypothetical protein
VSEGRSLTPGSGSWARALAFLRSLARACAFLGGGAPSFGRTAAALIGQQVYVKVVEHRDMGRVSLSLKLVDQVFELKSCLFKST